MTAAIALHAEGLTKHYPVGSHNPFRTRPIVRAVDGLDFALESGQTLAIVGESGSGKTTTAKLVLGLEQPTAGQVHVGQRNGVGVQAVFQDPWASLNPRMRIGSIIREPIRFARGPAKVDSGARIAELLTLVGLDASAARRFPHQLSGGQRQRVAIARALAPGPSLIVLDEPVSALDVSIRAQIINLLADLQEQLGTSYLMISHDLATVRVLAHQVAVMYAGRFVEYGPAASVLTDPQHPYTQALLSASLPARPASRSALQDARLEPIAAPPATHGCAFSSRCPLVVEGCRTHAPPEVVVADDKRVLCHLVDPAVRDGAPLPIVR